MGVTGACRGYGCGNRPETVNALKMFFNLFKYTPPGVGSWGWQEPIRAFAMKKTAMTISFNSTLQTVAQTAPDMAKNIGIALPYKKVKDVTHISTRGWSVFVTTKYPKEAKALLKVLYEGTATGITELAPLGQLLAYRIPQIMQKIKDSKEAKMFPAPIIEKLFSNMKGGD